MGLSSRFLTLTYHQTCCIDKNVRKTGVLISLGKSGMFDKNNHNLLTLFFQFKKFEYIIQDTNGYPKVAGYQV